MKISDKNKNDEASAKRPNPSEHNLKIFFIVLLLGVIIIFSIYETYKREMKKKIAEDEALLKKRIQLIQDKQTALREKEEQHQETEDIKRILETSDILTSGIMQKKDTNNETSPTLEK